MKKKFLEKAQSTCALSEEQRSTVSTTDTDTGEQQNMSGYASSSSQVIKAESPSKSEERRAENTVDDAEKMFCFTD